MPKVSRRKEIIKIQAEINEKEVRKTIVKINKTKSCFFAKIKLTNIWPDSSRKKRRIKFKNQKCKRKGYNRQCRNTKDNETIMNKYMPIK